MGSTDDQDLESGLWPGTDNNEDEDDEDQHLLLNFLLQNFN